MSYLILAFLFMSQAYATLEKIQIKNLDLTYTYPYGTGELERINLGVELVPMTMPIEVTRLDSSFNVVSPFVTFEYLNPTPFIHNIQNLETTKLNLNFDYKESTVQVEKLNFKAEKGGPFVFDKLDLKCLGSSLAIDFIKSKGKTR